MVEYTEKCPPLLAEKPVYIKNAFWAKLCVTAGEFMGKTTLAGSWKLEEGLPAMTELQQQLEGTPTGAAAHLRRA